MNNSEFINWETFKTQLQQNPNQILQFEYAAGKWVDPSYHITEIKQAPIISVDCGGVMNSWTEIIVQLWEPRETEEGRAMQASKAMSIVDIVEKKLPLNPNAIVKIEFGNSQFDTRQMYPGNFTVSGQDLIVNLTPDYTQCKAINRGGSCGTTSDGEECCAPVAKAEPVKLEMVNLAADGPVCKPGGCCC
ncbi:DUF6428 family protein [Sphingobacterium multivorum]|uniref:DUF6428 family protein n=1 Tax=Sphingobacterium multivorum TaxID=28454 RepID=UPI0028A8BA8E|nr:DUF6428 family protein [Sphingobacterium multivorum]